MNNIKRLSVLALLIALSLALTGLPGTSTTVRAQGDACAPDLSTTTALLESAGDSFTAGDTVAGLGSLFMARLSILNAEAQCTPDSMPPFPPGCNYRFDATVRSGPNSGANLHGTLVLIEVTPGSLTGYVFPAEGDPVPVEGQTADGTITMTFTLADGSTITGSGPMESSIADCAGIIEGTLTGPGAGDSGDWLGGGELSQCISAGISYCVQHFGANTQSSLNCSSVVVPTCQGASYQPEIYFVPLS